MKSRLVSVQYVKENELPSFFSRPGSGNGQKMPTDKPIEVKFDRKTAQSIEEPLANSYGLDLRDENLIGFQTGNIRFTVMGFRASTQYDTLIATVKVALHPHIYDDYTNVQKIDLYSNDRVNTYCRTSAQRLKVNEEDVKKAMYSLRERLERYRNDAVRNIESSVRKAFVSDKEQKQAMQYLKSDNLMDSIEGLLKQAGVVTEMQIGLQLFFILLSRHFDRPLHVLFQGSTRISRLLMDAVSQTVPEEELHARTSMSAGSMYYTRTRSYWKNKVLYLPYIDKQFRSASTIKEFIENGFLKRHTTESDYQTKQLYASTKMVEGAICLMGYCDDDAFNARFFEECFFIRVSENDKNRTDITRHIKMESGGLLDLQEKEDAIRQLRAIQQMISPMKVKIPFAMELCLPDKVYNPLRGLPQLFTFIKSVALLHQHQLKKKTDEDGGKYIEATPEHLEIAIDLFRSIVVSQGDYLTQGQRSFLEKLKTYVKDKDKSFKISGAMRELGMSKSSFYRMFDDVKSMGYVVRSGGTKDKGIDYRITEWDDYQQLVSGADSWKKQLKTIRK